MKTAHFKTLAIALLISTAFTTTTHAEIVGGTHWMVRPGESTYSIARKLYPDNLKQREQFRIELMRANTDVFRDGAQNMKVGSKLLLPEMAQTKPAIRTATPQLKPATQTVARKVTPDPEDTIGRVIINVGNVQAENRGSVRTLKRNSEILKGDMLKTANNSQAQIRFKDGALISLRSNTEFQIEEYAFNGTEDGTEKSVFNLIKGGFRTITGLIGHKNKNNYNVRTSVATIGIRGTHYGLMLCAAGSCANEGPDGMADGLYGGVVDGSIITENDTGIHQFNNDQYFHIASPQTPPVEPLVPPPVFHDQGQPEPKTNFPDKDQLSDSNHKADGDNRRPDQNRGFHNPMTFMAFNNEFRPLEPLRLLPDQTTNTYALPLPPIAPDGSGMALAFSHLEGTVRNGVGAPIIITPTGSNRIFLEQYTLPGGAIVNLPFAVHEESFDQNGVLQPHDAARLLPDGTGAVIADANGTTNFGGVVWGRWNGNYVILENGTPLLHDPDFHFIYSPNLTTPLALNNLGGIRSRIEVYGVIDGTLPTNNAGLAGTVLPNISFNVDFVNHRIFDYELSVNVGGLDWYGRQTNPASFNELNNSFFISGNCHNTTCDGEASVLFVGNAAGGAMSSYSLTDLIGGSISGVALMAPITNTQAADFSGALYAFNDLFNGIFTGQIITGPNRSDNIYTTVFNDGFINHDIPEILIEATALPSQATRTLRFDTTTIGTFLVDFTSASNVYDQTATPVAVTVNWGRWSAAAAQMLENGQEINHNDMHFIYSPDLTPMNILIDGTLGTIYGNTSIAYTTMGGTLPTDTAGNVGISFANINMGVNFSTQTIDTFSVSAQTGISAPISSYYVELTNPLNFTALGNGIPLVDPSITPACGGGLVACTGTARLNFIGPQAEGAITSYVIGEPNGSNTISGTALLTQGGF